MDWAWLLDFTLISAMSSAPKGGKPAVLYQILGQKSIRKGSGVGGQVSGVRDGRRLEILPKGGSRALTGQVAAYF